jgi:hypothetical protein
MYVHDVLWMLHVLCVACHHPPQWLQVELLLLVVLMLVLLLLLAAAGCRSSTRHWQRVTAACC